MIGIDDDHFYLVLPSEVRMALNTHPVLTGLKPTDNISTRLESRTHIADTKRGTWIGDKPPSRKRSNPTTASRIPASALALPGQAQTLARSEQPTVNPPPPESFDSDVNLAQKSQRGRPSPQSASVHAVAYGMNRSNHDLRTPSSHLPSQHIASGQAKFPERGSNSTALQLHSDHLLKPANAEDPDHLGLSPKVGKSHPSALLDPNEFSPPIRRSDQPPLHNAPVRAVRTGLASSSHAPHSQSGHLLRTATAEDADLMRHKSGTTQRSQRPSLQIAPVHAVSSRKDSSSPALRTPTEHLPRTANAEDSGPLHPLQKAGRETLILLHHPARKNHHHKSGDVIGPPCRLHLFLQYQLGWTIRAMLNIPNPVTCSEPQMQRKLAQCATCHAT
jgi:hypothetical protein